MKQNFLIFALLLLLLVCLGGCASGETADVPGATLGRTVVVDDNGVVFWGYGSYLCSGLAGDPEEMTVNDIAIKAQTTSDIRSLAIYNGYLFLDNEGEGIFRYNMADMEAGSVTPELVTEKDPNDGFEIWEDQVYFEYGGNLYQVPVTGGEPTAILRNMYTYSVTADGIYFTQKEGGIYRLSFDGALQERLVETGEKCHFVLSGDVIFYRCEENDQIYEYAMKDGSVSVVNKMQPLSDSSCLWATEQFLLYRSDDDAYEYNRTSGEEKRLYEGKILPDKEEGFWVDGVLYSYDQYRAAMYLIDPEQGVAILDMEQAVEPLLTQAASSATQTKTDASSGGYDITAGMYKKAESESWYTLCSDYIAMRLPNAQWDWEKTSNEAVCIYYTPARNAGYGGDLVTIKAYDLGDTSYQDLPAWAWAGADSQKTYIAIFPTDLRYDPSSSAQKQEYTELLEYVKAIGGQNSPFQLA